jgi:hypothetical protein
MMLPPGRVPRVARLMALVLRFDELARSGQISTYSELAILGHVTRARICQILNLLYLAPDIQEASPPTVGQRIAHGGPRRVRIARLGADAPQRREAPTRAGPRRRVGFRLSTPYP